MNLYIQRVIDGLKHHAGIADWGCWKVEEDGVITSFCPYYPENDDDNGPSCHVKLMEDAIELLKELEELEQ